MAEKTGKGGKKAGPATKQASPAAQPVKPAAATTPPVKPEAATQPARAEPGTQPAKPGAAAQQAGSATQPQPTPAQQQAAEENAAAMKEIESALFAIKFYPVAVDEKSKSEAVGKLVKAYGTGSETIRQLIIYMIHETLATSAELKLMHNLEYAKARNPALDPTQLRMNVYRAMFNYNTSLEGLVELIRLLGRLGGSDDAAKLLTYHFSHLCNYESEASHVLRAAILDALGKSDSHYALRALLEYARYSDNERMFNRIVSALAEWGDKIERLKMPEAERKKLMDNLQEIMTKDRGGTHYG